jgi:Uma2 family endonuclease
MSEVLTIPPISLTQPSLALHYPESDGKPLADNTKQARWIFFFFGNFQALFRHREDVFVAADLLWYPRPQPDEEPQAPDVMVVFGRPKGDRGSYKQWLENDIPVTVAVEIISPSNSPTEMADKLAFYDEYGVDEYYVYDPQKNRLLVYTRGPGTLRMIRYKGQFTSNLLGIRFDLSGPEMAVFYPDGRAFLSFEELDAQRALLQQRADNEKERADNEKERADNEKERADNEKERADNAEQRASRLAQLSRKARRQQATAEELEELERLENGND